MVKEIIPPWISQLQSVFKETSLQTRYSSAGNILQWTKFLMNKSAMVGFHSSSNNPTTATNVTELYS